MDRLERLQRMLLPSVKTDQPTCTFDVEELRGLVFRGISESDTSPRGPASSSGKAGTDTASDVLRPLAWRLLLGVVKGDPREWPDQLQCRRDDYHMWKRDLVGGTASQRGSGAARTEAEHHSDISLMKEIEKVVFRTRSELPLFSGGGIVQQQMLYVLFVFSRIHSDVGYIQGMNEVLAPIIYVCSCNPVTVSASEVEADAYHLFAAVMASLQVLYTRTPENPLSGADLQMTRLAKLLRQHDAALWQHLLSPNRTPWAHLGPVQLPVVHDAVGARVPHARHAPRLGRTARRPEALQLPALRQLRPRPLPAQFSAAARLHHGPQAAAKSAVLRRQPRHPPTSALRRGDAPAR
ncbi:hypothetical protein ON010_g10276 [Phytophthora cinnamomi]|nr:hypothetical protein ON010_g10276 [Phytophthora cinnamomi]